MEKYEVSLLTNKGEVGRKSGLNWGLQNGHSRLDRNNYAEAYIRIPSDVIDNTRTLIPAIPKRRSVTGKITRNFDPIFAIWDDNTKMEMIFEGIGVERPVLSKRKSNNDYDTFPKQLTSNDGGGYVLGEYIRKRLGVGPRELITIDHLIRYGRTTITMTKYENGEYYLDFSV
ncbi:restriction endonuclease PLD domain-containing protein [Streptococcus uberis]|uniref:restriction endonuclease PLD domain-containing protein n=1 Tax=Streptococcus uberis TaxID=1349 RepID=UPI0012B6747A|nr:restriction endonuclease PLD domain-containing protein [Streptococcus uberis]MTB99885.1 NgoFVII family restriction endonuclease [Streptococcus uberis]